MRFWLQKTTKILISLRSSSTSVGTTAKTSRATSNRRCFDIEPVGDRLLYHRSRLIFFEHSDDLLVGKSLRSNRPIPCRTPSHSVAFRRGGQLSGQPPEAELRNGCCLNHLHEFLVPERRYVQVISLGDF